MGGVALKRAVLTYLLGLVVLGLLAGCRQKGIESIDPTITIMPGRTAVPPGVAQPVTSLPIASSEVYLPLAANGKATPTPVASPPTPRPTATPSPAYPIYNGPPLDRNGFGLQVHLHRQDLRSLLRHLQALNVGWVKVQVSWKLHQPQPDGYSDEYFAELDALVSAATANDMAVLLSVSKGPEWSRPTTEMDGPPTDYTLYRAFMQRLAGRYRGRVAAYELWNEPNLQREWNGVPLSAADLVTLIRLGAAGVRAADPTALIISAAPATTGINDGLMAIDDRVYLRQMLAAGVADVVDGIGVHPYGWANPPDSSAAAPDLSIPSHNNHPSFFFRDTLFDYAAILNEFGLDPANKPLWVTEFGWGSFAGFDASPPAGAEFMSAVSEWQQAAYTLRAYELAHEWEWVGPMMLWNLNFGPTLGSDFSESGYSLLRPDGSLRPVYLSLQTIPKQ
jgi:hypothetical protein